MKCFLFGADNSSPTSSGATFNRLNSIFPSAWSANESLRKLIMPVAMSLSNFYMQVDVAPGTGTSLTYTIMKNSVATALAITISDTAIIGQDTIHSVSFAAGDTVSIQALATAGTPTVPNNEYWNVQVDSAGGIAPLLTGSNSLSATLTQYCSMLAGQSAAGGFSTIETDMQVIVPTSGTLSSLYVMGSAAPGTSKSFAFTLMKNGVTTALTTTLSGASTSASNVVNTVSVVAGDTLTIQSVPTGSPSGITPAFGVAFTPNNTGENFMGFGSATLPSATATNYEQILGIGNQGWVPSQAARYMMPGPCTLRGLYIKLLTAPGVGSSRTFTVTKSTGDTILSVTISGTNTTGSFLANVDCAQGDLFLLKSAITGTPAAATGGVHAGLLLYNDPKAPVVFIY